MRLSGARPERRPNNSDRACQDIALLTASAIPKVTQSQWATPPWYEHVPRGE